ncbi:hypothetical protein V6N11_017683 [Hibiscus sabdariffa]|uniref:Uncharacterized protein n=1 Tax=Hibiscus sabdariffa TaxID=183260 RepID=A0ABR2TYW0_9ROSI
MPQIKATNCGGSLSNDGKGISLISGTSTVIGVGAVITNQHSGQDFSRMLGPFDVNMGVDTEDSPISQAESLKRPRFQLSNSCSLDPSDIVTEAQRVCHFKFEAEWLMEESREAERRRLKRIEGMDDDRGIYQPDDLELQRIALNYFQNLFASQGLYACRSGASFEGDEPFEGF